MTTHPAPDAPREAAHAPTPLPMAPKEPCKGGCPDCPNRARNEEEAA